MILKRLYDEFDLAIERILIKEYKRLDLNMQELSVLLALFSIYKRRKTFSTSTIAKRVELAQEDIGRAVESLIDKAFITISLESKDGKQREVFNLDQTFIKIENLYAKDQKEKLKEDIQFDISKTIQLFEQGLGRPLMAYEFENIRKWYEEKAYSHETIMTACHQAADRISIKYVERLLNQNILEKIEIDEDVEKALDELYKSIK